MTCPVGNKIQFAFYTASRKTLAFSGAGKGYPFVIAYIRIALSDSIL